MSTNLETLKLKKPPRKTEKKSSREEEIVDTPAEAALRRFWQKYYDSHSAEREEMIRQEQSR